MIGDLFNNPKQPPKDRDPLACAPPPKPKEPKRIHPNSVKSYRGVNISKRDGQVIAALTGSDGMTDREIMHATGLPEKNSVSPSITRLKQVGIIVEIDTTKCPTTGKTVRIVKLNNGDKQQCQIKEK